MNINEKRVFAKQIVNEYLDYHSDLNFKDACLDMIENEISNTKEVEEVFNMACRPYKYFVKIVRILNNELENEYICCPPSFCDKFEDIDEVADYLNMFVPLHLLPKTDKEFSELAERLYNRFDGEYFQLFNKPENREIVLW